MQMRNATEPDGTGGNPRVGVPVRFSRPQIFFAPLSRVCPPCLPSPSPLFHTHTHTPSQAIKDSPHASPNDAVRAGAPTKQSAPIMLQAEGHNPTAKRVRDVASRSQSKTPICTPLRTIEGRTCKGKVQQSRTSANHATRTTSRKELTTPRRTIPRRPRHV